MKIEILHHARERMLRYNVEQAAVEEAVANPDSEVPGHGNRYIAQKKLDGYILRVVYEKQGDTKIVITVYKARRGRYEV